LVNWEIIGYALQSLYGGDAEKEQHFKTPRHGEGVWAPSIRYHNGEFYIYWGDPDYGIYMVKTKDPAGRWDDPVLVVPGKGLIDSCPLWDEDGRCYLVNAYAASRKHINSVLMVRELSPDGTRAIGNPVIVFDGNQNGNYTSEGPKFYKYNGYYYIMWPAGGVEMGWQMAARSKNVFGPYEYRTVMAKGTTNINGPHQGGWVHTPFGEDWFMNFQDKGCYGRVVHLNPLKWVDGWPVSGVDKDGDGCGGPVVKYTKPKSSVKTMMNPAESDEFNSYVLGKQWSWHANYDEEWGMTTPDGFLRLFNYARSEGNEHSLWTVPNLLLQKTPADVFTATAKVRVASKAEGQWAGLLMMGLDYSGLVVKRVGDGFELQRLFCKNADRGGKETFTTITALAPTSKDKVQYKAAIYEDIYLRMVVKAGGKVTFYYSPDGKKYTKCGDEFQMREGKWIGGKMGFVSIEPEAKTDRGWIDIDWFRVTLK
jgi:beta-xylosidase